MNSLSTSNQPLRLASYLAPRLYPYYQAAAATIEGATGRSVSLLEIADPSQLLDGEIDGAFVCGLSYTKLRKQDDRLEALVAPTPSGDRYRGRPVYFADLVVSTDSDICNFDQLAGARFAFNEEMSHSGYNMLVIELADRGLELSFFGRTIKSGDHEASLEMVRRGEADIAAIDSQLLDVIVAEDSLVAGEIWVLGSLGPWPIPPFVATSRISQVERAAIRAAFAQMLDWTPVDDAYYDMLRACEMP